MPTPHNSATREQIASTVLMPGDPVRSEFIAKTYLQDAVLVNDVRGAHGYTGKLDGKPVTVMASGMGMPSIGIYSYELYKFYDVQRIIRTGTAGAYTADLSLFDVVLATSVWSDSSFALVQSGDRSSVHMPSAALNDDLRASAARLGITLREGKVHSTDVYYAQTDDYMQNVVDKLGCCCVEMESFALLHNAKVLGREAACLLTISNSFVDDSETTTQERERGFTNMIRVALGAV